MKAVIQRVKNASLKVDGELVSEIGKGYVVYLGVGKRRGRIGRGDPHRRCGDVGLPLGQSRAELDV